MAEPIQYAIHTEIDIEDLARNMSHEQAEHAILAIDTELCDLDFTLDIAKKLCKSVFAEGVKSYNDDLLQFIHFMSTPNKGESK